MKSILKFTLLSLVVYTNTSFAQNILNPSFDSVYFGGIDRVFEWITSDGVMMYSGFYNDTVPALSPNTFYDATGFQFSELLWNTNQVDSTPWSSLAIEVFARPKIYQANGNHFESFVINGNHFYTDNNGYLDLSRCGIPFPHRPASLNGYYRFTDSTTTGNNFGKCIILLSKWNATLQQRDTIAFTNSSNDLNPTASWKTFSIPLNYTSTLIPDSIMVAFFGNVQPQNPSSLKLDELWFTYGGIGFEEQNQNFQIQFAPNPACDFIRFIGSIEGFKHCKFYNQSGALITEKAFSNPLSISEIPAGEYILELSGNTSETKTFKLSVLRD